MRASPEALTALGPSVSGRQGIPKLSRGFQSTTPARDSEQVGLCGLLRQLELPAVHDAAQGLQLLLRDREHLGQGVLLGGAALLGDVDADQVQQLLARLPALRLVRGQRLCRQTSSGCQEQVMHVLCSKVCSDRAVTTVDSLVTLEIEHVRGLASESVI